MLERLNTEERVIGGAALIALLSAYMTWISYDNGSVRTNLNGFRASIFGVVYVLAAGTVLLALAVHLRLLRFPVDVNYRKVMFIASGVAVAAIVVQALYSLDQGQKIHLASGIALLASAAMFLGSRRQRRNVADKFLHQPTNFGGS